MTNKFTPGPWAVFYSGYNGDRPGIEADIHNDTFSVVVYGSRDDAGVFGRTPEEAKANAHLIAAAPDMFNALKAAQAILMAADDNLPVIAERRQLVAAAIAKAEGL